MEPLDLTRRLQKRLLLIFAASVPLWGVIVLVLNLPEEERLPAFLCLPALTLLMCATIWILSALGGRLIVSTEGLIVAGRGGRRHVRTWDRYQYLYTLYGYKSHFLLFSAASLDAEAQLAAYRACRNGPLRFLPFREAEGCLLLDPMLAEKEILCRLPAHIRIVPAHQCALL